jgi:Ca-activated chloride channel homolog
MCSRLSIVLVFFVAISNVARADGPAAPGTPVSTQEDPGVIEIFFTYGSEKKNWIVEATNIFNANPANRIQNGQQIHVKTEPMGSGEIIEDLEKGQREVHLVSPAGEVYVILGNAASVERNKGDLIGRTESLVKTPIVIAMWTEMAKAIDWGGPALHWRDFFRYATTPNDWLEKTNRQWGKFKFGHTLPDHSNSGLHAIIIEAFAGIPKFENVEVSDLTINRDKVSRYVEEVERTIVHYGRSTGFLGVNMQEGGPDYLSAAILYESLVIEHNQKAKLRGLPVPQVVAIYPAEGTFMSDHPVGVVKRPWVTARHEEAARIYIKFLLSHEIQVLAKKSGFRPALPETEIPIADMLTEDRGVNPAEPKKILSPPDSAAIYVIQDIWREKKRPSDIVLAIDISGSMKDGNKLESAQKAAQAFILSLGEVDYLSIILFGTEVNWLFRDLRMDEKGKDSASKAIKRLPAAGDTALYFAIKLAHDFLENRSPNRRRAIIVLSDGADTKARDQKLVKDPVTRMRVPSPSEFQIVEKIEKTREENRIEVYTIGYSDSATSDTGLLETLKRIARAAKGKFYPANLPNILKVLSDDLNNF